MLQCPGRTARAKGIVGLKKGEGKTGKVVAKVLGIATPSLYRPGDDGKATAATPRGHAAAASHLQRPPRNPVCPVTSAHERLMAVNVRIEALTAEPDTPVGRMDVLAKKAVEVLRGGNK